MVIPEKIHIYTDTLVFFVNGKKVVDSNVDPEWTLLFYLRSKLRLCGTKLGCGEGGCGACTVMVSKYDRVKKKEIHIPVNACLAPVCAMHGLAVTTVEGIGSTKTKLHPVQERIAKSHGSQCGFCTPGMVMSMYTLLRQSPRPSWKEMEEALQGNLCRCTGYRPILEGFKTFLEDWEVARNGNLQNGTNGINGSCGMGEQCCKVKNGIKENSEENTTGTKEVLFETSKFTPYNASQEPIFPPELKLTDQYDKEYLKIEGPNATWFRPTTFNELLALKYKHPSAKLVNGNSEVGVEMKFKHMIYPVIIQPSVIKELTEIHETEHGVRVGAGVTLTDMRDFLRKQIETQPEEKIRIFQAIVEMLWWFAGKQIRSVGTLGGNIMTGSPISDLLPILMATRVELEVHHKVSGARSVILDDKFFTGYRKTVVLPDEVLVAVNIPYSHKNQYCQAYKQARRREDDIAIVNAAVNVIFEDSSNIIKNIHFGFGGMSFKTVTAPKTEENLKGLLWNKSNLELAYSWLLEDLPLDAGAPGGMIQYRRSLSLSLFFKAFLAISEKLQKTTQIVDFLEASELSGGHEIHEPKQKSSQYFTVVPKTQEKHDHLHRPIVHASAYKQASGEAMYTDDIPLFEGELSLAFVTSTKPYAKILKVDATEALKTEGVVGMVSADDIPSERNHFGTIVHDEKIFYNETVTSQGQIICGIVAKDQATAQKASRAVKVDYEDLHPVVVSIEDALKHKSWFSEIHRSINKGDVDKAMQEAPHVIESQCRMGGQEHFYFETQGVVAVPKGEDDEMEVYASTQHPAELTHLIGEALGVLENKIYTKVKRIGGGFGGKESKAAMISIPVTIAAKKFNRPIRCMLDRDEDMMMTGDRHPFLIKYKVGFDNSGRIFAMDVHAYSNGGYSVDLSPGVLERAMFHIHNAYEVPHLRIKGTICKTNLPSNTAFRGFGGPQGMFAAENIAQDIADFLNVDRAKVSEINLCKEGYVTHYNQKVLNCNVEKCWKQCLKNSKYYERRKKIKEYNRQNRYKKRGIAVIPTKFGIAFTAKHLNQAGALVLVYTDGSVLLSHGGIEMGQGIYTKMLQIASKVLEIPIELIHTSGTGTDKVPNSSPTAASTGSDLNGMAVLNACQTIKDRLKPYREGDPKGTWHSWVQQAYFDRVSLSATGFYATPDIGYDWDKNEGNVFRYHTYGAACTEVEIDCLTGDHRVLSTEIVMDLGESINPAIDIGQIEGAFMQGYGLFVLEELVYSPTGTLYSRGPGTYKIPGFGDIPAEFNVSLLKGTTNPQAVYSSKAVGEPPLFLASAALFAIKEAIMAARLQNGVTESFKLDAPATAAKIRMACKDNITAKIKDPEPGTFKPWNIVV